MNISFRQLRAAVSIAEHGSFRRAAESLHLSQPALSLTIAELERALGVTLFDRTSRSVSATEMGNFFVQGAARVLSDLDRLVNDVTEVAQSRRGRVVVSCVSSIAGRVMPLALIECARRFPQVDVIVRDDVAQQVLSAVRTREADFGLTIEPAELPEETVFEALQKDRFHLACRRDHPLAKRRRVSWKDLNGHSLILLSTTSGIHRTIDDELVRQNIQLERQTPVSHLSTVHGMLESGFGVAVLPVLGLPVSKHPTLVTLPLTQPVLHRTIGIFHRKDRSFSPAAAALLDVLRSVLRSPSVCASNRDERTAQA
jgi:DNA-binding transcriptional LysR family regulator